MRILLAFFLVTFSVPAVAGSRWYYVASTPDAVFYVDDESIRDVGLKRDIWVLSAYRTPIVGGVSYVKELFRESCASQTFQIVDQHAYGIEGQVIAARTLNEAATVEHVVPDSNDAAIASYACTGAKSALHSFPIDRTPVEAAQLTFALIPYVDARIGAAILAGCDPWRTSSIFEEIIRKHVAPHNAATVRRMIGMPPP